MNVFIVLLGPGLYCYAVCCASALLRAIVHWLTPLPNMGAVTVAGMCDCGRYQKLEECEPCDLVPHTSAKAIDSGDTDSHMNTNNNKKDNVIKDIAVQKAQLQLMKMTEKEKLLMMGSELDDSVEMRVQEKQQPDPLPSHDRRVINDS